MESLVLCSKVLYDRDIIEKQKEIVELKKKYYCAHGKPTLHIYNYFNDDYFEDFDTDLSDPNILINRCTKLLNDIGKSIFKLFDFVESTYESMIRESWGDGIVINIAILESIKENFKKITNNDPEFKNELTQILFNNLMSFTESCLNSKEKTDEIIKNVYDMYPIIYDEYDFPGTLERLIKLIRYKIFGVYEEDDLTFPDDEEELITILSNKFEIIYHCDECKKIISSSQDTKTFSKCKVCRDCIKEMYSQISKYKRRKIKWIEYVCDEVESLIES